MKVIYVKDIMEDIIEAINEAAISGRDINGIALTKEEADEFDMLMIKKGYASLGDKLVLDGYTVVFNEVPIYLEEEKYVH